MAACDNLLHSCLYFTAGALSRTVSRMAEEEFMRTGLSPSHAFLLMVVNQGESATQKDLGEQLHLAPSTVTRFVDELVRRGLVRRQSEGKSTLVAATPAGTALTEPIATAWKGLHDRYSALLGEEAGAALTKRIDEATQSLAGR